MSWIDAVFLNLLFSYQDHRKIFYCNKVDNGSSMNTFAVAIHNSDQNISHSSLSKEEQNGANKNYKKCTSIYFNAIEVQNIPRCLSSLPITYFNSNISIF